MKSQLRRNASAVLTLVFLGIFAQFGAYASVDAGATPAVEFPSGCNSFTDKYAYEFVFTANHPDPKADNYPSDLTKFLTTKGLVVGKPKTLEVTIRIAAMQSALADVGVFPTPTQNAPAFWDDYQEILHVKLAVTPPDPPPSVVAAPDAPKLVGDNSDHADGAPPAAGIQPTGQIFKDAIILENALEKQDTDTEKNILIFYNLTGDKNNPFINTEKFSALFSQNSVRLQSLNSTGSGVSSFRAFGQNPEPFGYDIPSAIIGAITDKIIATVKEDIIIIFLMQARNYLQNSAQKDPVFYSEVVALFPRAEHMLENVTNSQIATSGFLLTLRDAAQNDLSSAPDNIDVFLASRYPKGTLRYSVQLMGQIGYDIVAKKHPPVIVDDLEVAGAKFVVDADTDAKKIDAGIKIVDIVSRMLADPNSQGWIPFTEVYQAIEQVPAENLDRFTLILLGLSYVQDHAIYNLLISELNSSDNVIDKLSETKDNAGTKPELLSIISAISESASRLDDDAQRLDDLKTSVTKADLDRVAKDLQNFLNILPELKCFIPDIVIDPKTLAQLTTLVDLAIDTRAQNFRLLAADVARCLPVFLPDKPETGTSSFVTWLNGKPGQLVVGLATANNDDEAKAVLSDVLDSNWTFLDKQNSLFSVDLTGYCGVEVGRERLSGDTTGTQRYANRGGLSAPVGLSLTKGIKEDTFLSKAGLGSCSLFLPVIDVGSLVSYRFSSGSDTLPPVTFSNIISPGAFVVFEFKNLPICLMVGTQYGPALRKVSTTAGNTIERAAWQVPEVGITFDVPLLNLFHSNR